VRLPAVFSVVYQLMIFGMLSGFISRSVHARLQFSVCSSYDLFHPS